MTLDASIFEPPAPAAPAAAEPRIAVAQMWLCMLGGLVQTAERLYGFLVREMAPYPNGPKGSIFAERCFGDTLGAFQRVVRALRFADLLRLKLEKEIAGLRAGLPLGPHAFLSRVFRTRALSKNRRAEEANGQEAWGQEGWENLAEHEAPARFDALSAPAWLNEDARFQALLKSSLKKAIATLCDDLGLKPDRSLWTDTGFPPPPDGGVEDWVAFFDLGPVTPPAGHIWDGRLDEAWRSAWPPPDFHAISPAANPAAPRPWDRGGSP